MQRASLAGGFFVSGRAKGSKEARKETKMSLDRQKFGMRIRCARKEKGWNQQELADRVKVESQHISRIERGIVSCSVDILVRLSEALQVGTDYLLLGSRAPLAKEQLEEIARQLAEIANTL